MLLGTLHRYSSRSVPIGWLPEYAAICATLRLQIRAGKKARQLRLREGQDRLEKRTNVEAAKEARTSDQTRGLRICNRPLSWIKRGAFGFAIVC